jgi:dihydroxy-acid dehydratase
LCRKAYCFIEAQPGTIDIPNRRLDARVDFAARTPQPAPAREIPPGYMRRYVKHVSSAARGAVLE